jgi:hypothetical protein
MKVSIHVSNYIYFLLTISIYLSIYLNEAVGWKHYIETYKIKFKEIALSNSLPNSPSNSLSSYELALQKVTNQSVYVYVYLYASNISMYLISICIYR